MHHIYDGVHIGTHASAPDTIWPTINCCQSSERSGGINVVFADGPLYVNNRSVYKKARSAFDWAMNKRVDSPDILIRSHHALNRSALIAGLVLIAEGREPEQVIDRIRKVRGPQALSNTSFVWLLLAGPLSVGLGERVYYQGSLSHHHGQAVVLDNNGTSGGQGITIATNNLSVLTNVRPQSIRRGWMAQEVSA